MSSLEFKGWLASSCHEEASPNPVCLLLLGPLVRDCVCL